MALEQAKLSGSHFLLQASTAGSLGSAQLTVATGSFIASFPQVEAVLEEAICQLTPTVTAAAELQPSDCFKL